eukprot:scpid67290/ scgid7028/ 
MLNILQHVRVHCMQAWPHVIVSGDALRPQIESRRVYPVYGAGDEQKDHANGSQLYFEPLLARYATIDQTVPAATGLVRRRDGVHIWHCADTPRTHSYKCTAHTEKRRARSSWRECFTRCEWRAPECYRILQQSAMTSGIQPHTAKLRSI